MRMTIIWILTVLHLVLNGKTYGQLQSGSFNAKDYCINIGHIGKNPDCPPANVTVPVRVLFDFTYGPNSKRGQVALDVNMSCGPNEGSLCNPVVFGYNVEALSRIKREFPKLKNPENLNTADIIAAIKPYCVQEESGQTHSSQLCYKASMNKYTEPVLKKYNDKLVNKYESEFKLVCGAENINRIDNIFKERSPQNENRFRTRDLCDWANWRLSKFEPSRFIDHGDTRRPEPGADQEPRWTRSGISSPYAKKGKYEGGETHAEAATE